MNFANSGKTKAITFSLDDGVTQDIRMIELLKKYNLKATFNLNSELLSKKGMLIHNGMKISHYKVHPDDVRELYGNHEIAVHTLTHPNLTESDDAEVIRQVETDRKNLTELAGYDVIGMAYPCGGVNNDERVAKLIKENTGVKYSRTITSTYNFETQENLYRFNPTIHFNELDRMLALGKEFVELKTDTPKIFYVWGHSYEMDIASENWVKLEEFFKLVSNKDDIFYGTNKEVLL